MIPLADEAVDSYGQSALYQLFGSDSPANTSNLGSSEVDKLLRIPDTIPDQLKAVAAANKAEAKAYETLYGTMPTPSRPDFRAVKKGLANWVSAGFQTIDPAVLGWQR